MTELFGVAAKIATPLGLIGFVAALLALYFYKKLEQFKLLPPKERAAKYDEFLIRLDINGKELDKDQKFSIITEELERKYKNSRFYAIILLTTFITSLLIASGSYLYSLKVERSEYPQLGHDSANTDTALSQSESTANADSPLASIPKELYCICSANQTFCFVSKSDCQKINSNKECSLIYPTKDAFNVSDTKKWSTYNNNSGWVLSTRCAIGT